MVVFTCGACGESLKKARVEKHVLKCRACQVLSCIDCSKDFWGDDYKNHNKCISEDQKYGGKDFQAKVNKGDVKQQQWIQRIQQAMEQPDVDPSVWKVLQMVSTHDNVPRKRAKFENWMKNCLKIYTPFLLEKVWEICSTDSNSNHQTANERKNDGAETKENKRDERKNKKSKRKTSEEQNGEKTDEKQRRKKRKREENGQNADEKSSKKQKKRKQEESGESLNPEGEEPENQESESNSTGKFNWKGTIKALLRDAPEDGLAVKKLRKKVLAAYHSFTGDSNFRSEEELLSLFNRKINNNPKFKILKDRVRLLK
ncbi:cell growth-regulating nucleolar protein [Sinocyclocheilus grahami]|uniref:Cell growth-regulating nucleolar protein n=1 Tax=Sinocyclocheilus grahami TaxID=75366 RepID=A0A672PS66_SINGR|nr:PREDICTED: cell growth-regulating nucleolar protein [Sinocyclocheilus grahami]XP_016108805.1 PREDICTED: cell growth-regulating nucleolar protein [Sinocyclocheilus grahami]XP_016108806.1 PREDICTED: cell growth-regulating nucleolar protein [Sinocyclocheilus grahami]XP_016108807.1 PREDICTED: cell growth-regulating nucleolar protein [Sinocyclocheilus grahami]